MSCAFGGLEGGTSTAAHITFVEEGKALEAKDLAVNSAIGCVTAGVVDAASSRVFRQANDVRKPTPCNSFPTGTLVLLADGSRAPIDQIEPGDTVVGYDTETGVFGSHQVLDQWSHLDDGDMVTVTLEDGTSVSATDDHLFWLADDRSWVEAEDLQAGDQLLDADGTTETVTNVDVYTPAGGELVWELSVADVHTFTVHTGTADVVVHNARRCDPQNVLDWRATSEPDARNYPFDPATIGDAGRLRDNLEVVGISARGVRVGPDGIQRKSDQAHHIVIKKWDSDAADDARAVLERVGIDIDDPNNGVFLEGPGLGTPDPDGRAIHGGELGGVHREGHIAYVRDRLQRAERDGGRDSVLDALNEIRDELLAGEVNVVPSPG